MIKKISKFFLVASFLTILVLPTKTYAVSWFPLVPCGLNQQPKDSSGIEIPKSVHDYMQPCNQCLLVELGKNIIDMTFYAIVPSVGTLLFLIAGFIILFNARSGNPAGVGKGKQIMTDTAIGIAIVLSSWLITNFILKSIASEQVASTPWYQIKCTVSTLKETTDQTVPPSNGGGTGGGTGTGTGGTGTGGGTGSTGPGAQCTFNGVDYATANLCSGLQRPGGCGTSTCSQYLPAVQKYANGAATVQVLKTFMVIESDCNTNAGTGTSYGLMQLTPTSVAPFAYRCPGAPSTGITDAWLKANPDLSVCLAAAYINGVSAGSCGSDLAHIYAGYNGNAVKACAPSADCIGNSCSGGSVEAWECPYNDSQHATCNTGYYQTKQGGMYVNYCKNNLGF